MICLSIPTTPLGDATRVVDGWQLWGVGGAHPRAVTIVNDGRCHHFKVRANLAKVIYKQYQ
jgi:hypothetical protein